MIPPHREENMTTEQVEAIMAEMKTFLTSMQPHLLMAIEWIRRESSEDEWTLVRRSNGRVRVRHGQIAQRTYQELMTIEREKTRWKAVMEEFRVRLMQAVWPVLPLVLQNEELTHELRIRCIMIDEELYLDEDQWDDFEFAKDRFLQMFRELREQDRLTGPGMAPPG